MGPIAVEFTCGLASAFYGLLDFVKVKAGRDAISFNDCHRVRFCVKWKYG
jgi:hypothetical protein